MDGEQTLATLGGYLVCLRGILHDQRGIVTAEVDANGLLMLSWVDAGVRHLHIIDADHWVVDRIIDSMF
jgi:hypothetical protein